ncbi:YybH family protein [Nonomuraea sp. NPDC002799]
MIYAQQPEDLHELFKAGVNNKDIDGLMALYESDSLTIDLDGNRVEGVEALRAMLTGLVSAIEHMEGTTRKVIVHGDYALLSATFRGKLAGSPGEITGSSGEVARRQPDGTWRFLIDDPAFA